MQFAELRLAGVWLLTPERRTDPRGYFARTFCSEEFAAFGLPQAFPQCNVSFNTRRGTLRGLHWQGEPFPEGKLVRCTRGAIFDVAVDLRAASPTRGEWVSAELTADNGHALYIPPGFAHGFQTFVDGSEVFYQMTASYAAKAANGLRWNDPFVNIAWPVPEPFVSERDSTLPFWE